MRYERQCRNAGEVANFLASRSDVVSLRYPGWRSHPQHELACAQQSDFGSIISFDLSGGPQAASRFAEALRLFAISLSLGSTESLVLPPQFLQPRDLDAEEHAWTSVTDGTVRLSIGIEDSQDLISDIESALDEAQRVANVIDSEDDTPVMIREDRNDRESPCRLFRSSGFADTGGSYFIHNRNSDTAKIGVMCQGEVTALDGRAEYAKAARTTAAEPLADLSEFKRAEKLARRDAPAFFLVSADIKRRFADQRIPQIYLVQPSIEFTFSPDQLNGSVTYAEDSVHARQGEEMLRAALAEPLAGRLPHVGGLRPFSEPERRLDDRGNRRCVSGETPERYWPAAGVPEWEDDVGHAVAYEREHAGGHDPFGLYELHAGMNGDYVFSHFACIREGVVSVGVTPENVFEVRGRALTVDVVAATCRSGQSDEYVDAELRRNPKQLKEHRMSLTNRQNRFRPVCEEGSIRCRAGHAARGDSQRDPFALGLWGVRSRRMSRSLTCSDVSFPCSVPVLASFCPWRTPASYPTATTVG